MSYTRPEKRTFERMYSHTSRHNIRRWLTLGAKDEDARTIGEALTRISDRRLARWLARLLTNRD